MKIIKTKIRKTVLFSFLIALIMPLLPINAAPSAPGNLSISGDQNKPTLSWDAVLDDEVTGGEWIKRSGQISNVGERSGHASVVFNNKLWILGGYAPSGEFSKDYSNDVWSSSDGSSWIRVTEHAAWPARQGHATVVFDGKIWVIGGYANAQTFNDVWYSSDGVNWTEATGSAAWLGRTEHTSVVFDNKMWVIGGYTIDEDYYAESFNDVWYSSDGVNWTEATGSAAWPVRAGHTSVVFDNKIWVMGGGIVSGYVLASDEGAIKNDVWYSSDGVNWTEATGSAAWSDRTDQASVVFNEKIWVFGGRDINGDGYNDVWYSPDGVNWTEATSSASWQKRLSHTANVFNGKVWLINGEITGVILLSTGEVSKLTEVWSSSDGINWTLSSKPNVPEWPGLGSISSTLSYQDKMWVIGFTGNSYDALSVWSSLDGYYWTEATAGVPWGVRYYYSTVVYDGKMWVIGGTDDSGNILNDVWYSEDGANWIQATDNAGWIARTDHSSVVFDDKIWVLGGYDDNSGENLNDVWYSSDGINWTEATPSAGWSARAYHSSVVFDNKIWVTGGNDGYDQISDVWYSSDGINWTEATSAAAWGARGYHKLMAFDNKLWVIGGSDYNWNTLDDIWSSSDGITWNKVTDDTPWTARSEFGAVVFKNKLWVLGGINSSDGSVANDSWSTPDTAVAHYKLCWDKTDGGCVYSVNVDPQGNTVSPQDDPSVASKLKDLFLPATLAASNRVSYTLNRELEPGAWYFSVYAVNGEGEQSVLGAAASIEVTPGLPNTGIFKVLPLAALVALFAFMVALLNKQSPKASR